MRIHFVCLYRLLHAMVGICVFLQLVSCAAKPPAALPTPPQKPAKVAVVLGAGASRGFAHIGVLKILESHRIPIHMVIGTSVGSLVGSLYAYGYNPYDLQKIALAISKEDVIDYTIPDNGFIKGEKLENFVNRKVKNTTIDKFRIPFYAVATNIQTGQEMVFGRGSAGRAVRASCAIPGIVNPVMIGDKVYMDGAVVSPVAVDAARRFGADVVIAVDISAALSSSAPRGTMETIMRSIDMMNNKMAVIQLKNADVVIRPRVENIGSSDFTKRHEAIMEGEKATAEAMPAINRIITGLRRDGRLP
ncbi:MAG: Patatin [Deltaproteobacteria bacterium HGW-Deltaproteobacteria-9]|nr:MAG: Patatin [Deltaproteobacteria bacterium HGW-Deltaproteobacteria-9]